MSKLHPPPTVHSFLLYIVPSIVACCKCCKCTEKRCKDSYCDHLNKKCCECKCKSQVVHPSLTSIMYTQQLVLVTGTRRVCITLLVIIHSCEYIVCTNLDACCLGSHPLFSPLKLWHALNELILLSVILPTPAKHNPNPNPIVSKMSYREVN